MLTFLVVLVLTGLALAVGVFGHNSIMTGRTQWLDRQAMSLAEAGWQRGRQAFAEDVDGWGADTSNTETFGPGQYTVAISAESPYTIISTGYVGTTSNYQARREIVESNVTRAAAGSSNSATSATASASSTHSSSSVANANDGSTSTTWRADTQGSGEWLRLLFGSDPNLNRIIIREEQYIAGVNIQSCTSSDTSSCSTVSGLSCSESGTTWTCNFTTPSGDPLYYRAVFTATASNRRVEVQEMESYNTAATGYTLNDGTFGTGL